MEKVIKKHLTISPTSRGIENLECEIYSNDKQTAVFKFTADELTAQKVIFLFYFKDTKRYKTVEATIEGNNITVPFDSSLITTDEQVVCYVYFEKVEKSTDVYSFTFGVRVSAIDRANETPLIERKAGRIVDVENIVTKHELDELFAKIKEQGGTYDDSNLRAELNNKADHSEIERISRKIEALEQKTDKDTIYDDKPLKSRLSALESKPEIDTSVFATKQELESKAERNEISRIANDVELLKAKTDKDTIYDDSTLKQRVSALESKSEIDTSSFVTKQELNSKGYLTAHQPLTEYAKKSELPQPYNDTEIKSRVARLEIKPELDTSGLVTKQELASKGYLTAHQPLTEYAKKAELPQPYNDTELKVRIHTLETKTGTPQKISIAGNVVTLSGGGGSVTLPETSQNASTSSSELTGTGMPNGKVEGKLGQTYVDTAKTNGALKWIKRTPSGNTGWAVLDGDTGWKTLNSTSKLGNSYVKARRINDIVQLQFGGLQWGWFGIVRRGGLGFVAHPGNREKKVFILTNGQMPYGYRTATSLIGPIYNDDGVSYGTWYLGGYGDANHLRFQFLDPIPADKDIGDIRVSNISYFTDDPWPTT
nr:MAG TPA: hypothetical protein [Caudoviricetes sp.]